jgi:hypothetical protein
MPENHTTRSPLLVRKGRGSLKAQRIQPALTAPVLPCSACIWVLLAQSPDSKTRLNPRIA